MPIKNSYRYIKVQIDVERLLGDTLNKFLFVSQRPYKGKSDKEGNEVIKPGANVTLQIISDISEPIVDKETGEIKENNELETFDVTIEGCKYPLSFKKGDKVSLGKFDKENSFYVNYNLILRFREIYLAED